jgi:hypothetical protein
MSRHNNTSRSLQIISRGQGWDPSKIQSAPGTPDGKDFDLDSIGYHARESPLDRSTTQDSPFPGDATDPFKGPFTVRPPGPDERGRGGKDGGPQGDPYPDMPGAKPTRGKR